MVKGIMTEEKKYRVFYKTELYVRSIGLSTPEEVKAFILQKGESKIRKIQYDGKQLSAERVLKFIRQAKAVSIQ